MSRSRVALNHGDNRHDSVAGALQGIASEINLDGVERPLVKPNLVTTNRPLAAVNLEANASLASCRRAFRSHDTCTRQTRWPMPGSEKILRRAK